MSDPLFSPFPVPPRLLIRRYRVTQAAKSYTMGRRHQHQSTGSVIASRGAVRRRPPGPVRRLCHWIAPTGLAGFASVAAATMLGASGCAHLPDTRFLTTHYAKQSARLKTALGPLSDKKSAAAIARLQPRGEQLDILDQQITLEQEIVGRPLVTGNKVTLLQDGPATYAAMLAAMRGAKAHINVESYIFDDSDVGLRFAEVLIERQAAGVQVNVIYDSVGAIGTKAAFYTRLKEAGVQVMEFNPVNPLTGTNAWQVTHRDHRKLLIVDGRTAFLGGINISSVYSSGSSFRKAALEPGTTGLGWRDTDVQIDGPAVNEFQRLFLATWNKQRGEPVGAHGYFPEIAPQGIELVRAVGSTPDDPYSYVYLTLIAAIMNAKKRVCLTNAYFVPDPQLTKALLDAAARGVDVTLVLPSHSDSALTFFAGRSHYEELLRGGVKIHERRGAPLHVKTAIVDGVWSCVGSSNLDWRSALDNDEINAVILGRDFAAQMLAAFTQDLLASDEIKLAEWRHRAWALRMKEATARVFDRLL
jgi:cardiolipin synthase